MCEYLLISDGHRGRQRSERRLKSHHCWCPFLHGSTLLWGGPTCLFLLLLPELLVSSQKYHCHSQNQEGFSLFFFLGVLQCQVTFKSLIFELIFVHCADKVRLYSLTRGLPSFPSIIYWKKYLFTLCVFLGPLPKIIDSKCLESMKRQPLLRIKTISLGFQRAYKCLCV